MNSLRFRQLWNRNLNPGEVSDAEQVFDYLATHYSDPSLNYHDGRHIDDCLGWFDQYRDRVADPDAVELAIWFHDVCFKDDPVKHELRGAELIRQLLTSRMSPERLDNICQMILLTSHQVPPENADQALMVDVDLGSFCQPWAPYLRDTARCRAEMRERPESDYCACQIRFLRGLIGRDNIYYLPEFRGDHEVDARANISRLIQLLEARSAR